MEHNLVARPAASRTAPRLAKPRALPGFILFVQTFGDLVNFNPQRARARRAP
jgi:hypothetical protein